MRLPDDYEDHGGGLTPTVISAIVAVTIFVAVILTVVLIMNRQPTSHQQNNTAAQTENVQQAGNNQTDKYPDTQDLITGSTLTPSDLDFWDMYPETTATPLPSADPSQRITKGNSGSGSLHRWKTYPGDQPGRQGRMGADQPVPSQTRI